MVANVISWLARDIISRKNPGEIGPTMSDINKWRQNKLKKIDKKYAPEDIYDNDEAGHFFPLLLSRTFTFEEEYATKVKKTKTEVHGTSMC